MSLDPSGQIRNAVHTSPTNYYYGTIGPAMPGATIAPGYCGWADAEALLNASGPPNGPCRSTAVRAASSKPDAAAIAAIYSYSRTEPVPHDAIHVYRVQLAPFHIGPVALIDELQNRLAAVGGAGLCEALIREYWEPTGIWHVREVLAPSLTILEEVPATSERDVYLRRWVHFNLDGERARAL
jgi:hypothetical protein